MQTLPFQKLKLDNFLSSKEFFDRGLDILSHFYEQKLRKFAMIILNQRKIFREKTNRIKIAI